ncbi:hypothetical protein A4R35_09215 [Thermogemmatispora tikiterensis]|uniref:Uncharacterized protein n=1 Tax=Thermogemmatispora tikiterensis TaxID=1825093 RepID=A0A328VHZ2_9CHLR|nr:hypothetical protein A4R35_09215 [Thermogemmatispora tikiterensis]
MEDVVVLSGIAGLLDGAAAEGEGGASGVIGPGLVGGRTPCISTVSIAAMKVEGELGGRKRPA